MGLFDLFSDKNEKAGMQDYTKSVQKGAKEAGGYLEGGIGNLRTQYGSALDEYSPYAESGRAATGLYSDALGLNGAEGNTRATGAFQTGPGYQFAMDQGLQALERRASSQGRLAGGQTSLDTIGYAQGLGNQEYGSWLDRLNGQQGMGMDAAAGRAGIQTGLGQAEYGYGADRGNLAYTSNEAIGNAKRDYQIGKDQTGANIFGAITGGISMGAQLLGFGGGGGGFGMMGPAGNPYTGVQSAGTGMY